MLGEGPLEGPKLYLKVCHPLEKREKGECPTLISGSKLLLPPNPFDMNIPVTIYRPTTERMARAKGHTISLCSMATYGNKKSHKKSFGL